MQVLIQVWLEPALPIGVIAERLALERRTVGSAVEVLRDHGLLQAETSAEADARTRLQTVNANGEAVVDRFLADVAHD